MSFDNSELFRNVIRFQLRKLFYANRMPTKKIYSEPIFKAKITRRQINLYYFCIDELSFFFHPHLKIPETII